MVMAKGAVWCDLDVLGKTSDKQEQSRRITACIRDGTRPVKQLLFFPLLFSPCFFSSLFFSVSFSLVFSIF